LGDEKMNITVEKISGTPKDVEKAFGIPVKTLA